MGDEGEQQQLDKILYTHLQKYAIYNTAKWMNACFMWLLTVSDLTRESELGFLYTPASVIALSEHKILMQMHIKVTLTLDHQ